MSLQTQQPHMHSFMKHDQPDSWKCPLPNELTCNDHKADRRCICYKRASDTTPALYPYCDKLIHMDRVFGKVVTLTLNFTANRKALFKCEYSRVVGAHFPYRSLDEALTSNLQMCGKFEENGVVILRKRCNSGKFQIQIAIMKQAGERLENLTDDDFASFYKYHISRFMGRSFVVTEFENADRLFPIIDDTPLPTTPPPPTAPVFTPKPVQCFSFIELNFYHCGNAHYILYCTLGTCIFALFCGIVYYDRMMSKYEKKVVQIVRMNVPDSRVEVGFSQQQTLL